MSNNKGLSDVNRINEGNISNKIMTAVEWLESKFSEFETIYDSLPSRLYEYVNQAKEIEKQQIIEAYGVKVKHSIEQGTTVYTRTFGEQYYNETFNK